MIICSGRVIRAAKETAAVQQSDTNSINRSDVVCSICGDVIRNETSLLSCINRACKMKAHIKCLAGKFLEHEAVAADSLSIIPIQGECPTCRRQILWGDLIRRFNGALDLVAVPADESLEEDEDEDCVSDISSN